VKRHVDAVLAAARVTDPTPPPRDIVDDVVLRLATASREALVPVLNGSGILLHTNLGRAPLAREALDAIDAVAGGASNLEYDLDRGVRGSRYDRLAALLRESTGAEASLVVNNCAAAVLLALDTFARGAGGSPREVIVARNRLIEIGGGFRLPDVLARSGAALVEVGTTNKVRVDDYARALSPHTAMILLAHASNFRIEGFTEDADPAAVVALGRRAGVAVVEDLGGGALCDLREYGLPRERTVQDAVADGVDVVAFSGDKLLGGPQAGLLVGRTAAIARMRANPLLRALRVGAPTLAALGATLALHARRESRERIPFYRMLAATIETLRARADAIAEQLPALHVQAVVTDAYAGGGALPLVAIPSVALVWRPGNVDAAAARLRRAPTSVIVRADGDALALDLRTIPPERDAELVRALAASL